jgi:Fic family protein
LIRRSIFGTAAIEGNTLDEAQVGDILAGKTHAEPGKFELEISNLKKAYGRYADYPAQTEPLDLSEETIKDIHSLITQGLAGKENIPGQYRNAEVKVGDVEHGGVYTPPKILADIKLLMTEFTAWINSPEIKALHPGVRACLAHYHLGLIHPFRDGNGRTARLVEAMMLSASGLRFLPKMLSNYYYKNIHEYFTAFRDTEKNKSFVVNPFIVFFCKGFNSAAYELKSAVDSLARKLALPAYFLILRNERRINDRQLNLLQIMQETGKPISLVSLYSDAICKNLYAKVSEQTARRDLKKLLEMNLLRRDGQEYALNPESFEKPRP